MNKEEVSQAVKDIFATDRYWELEGFHEANTEQEVMEIREKLKDKPEEKK